MPQLGEQEERGNLDEIYSLSSGEGSSSECEIQQFFSEPPEPKSTNMLQFWKTQAKVFPTLASMAHKYLSISATSAPLERVFSGGRKIITYPCASLSSMHASRIGLICLVIPITINKPGESERFVEGNVSAENLISQLECSPPQTFRPSDVGVASTGESSHSFFLGLNTQCEYSAGLSTSHSSIKAHQSQVSDLSNFLANGLLANEPQLHTESQQHQPSTSLGCTRKRKSRISYSSDAEESDTSVESNTSQPSSGKALEGILENLQPKAKKDQKLGTVSESQKKALYSVEEEQVKRTLRIFTPVNGDEKGQISTTKGTRSSISLYRTCMKTIIRREIEALGNDKRYGRLKNTLDAKIILGEAEINEQKDVVGKRLIKLNEHISKSFVGYSKTFPWQKNTLTKISQFIETCTKLVFADIRLITESHYPALMSLEEVRHAQLEALDMLEHIWILVFLREGKADEEEFEFELAQIIREVFRVNHRAKGNGFFRLGWFLTAAFMRVKLHGLPSVEWNSRKEFGSAFKTFVGNRAILIHRKSVHNVAAPWSLEFVTTALASSATNWNVLQ
ncbi:hypothetical protein O181_024938 [Austropuccinia psidii MF-1]|uniref:HAT C-terminal dimerisation domain-containing protein n=1 Tax=Austropuccinia psidii MF-1 TaxID=1389203 RepID=A0A9Q3CJT3_9BASI|nr:hypothetical protein [Austropuccinia psidii MF-1]